MLRRINKVKNLGRFIHLRSDNGRQGDFTRFNVIYGRNASGKSTLCDMFRSLSLNQPSYLIGRKRFAATTNTDIEILLNGTPTSRMTFDGNVWAFDPAGTPFPRMIVFDDRFVAENVVVGHSIAIEQRRSLFGLVVGDRGQALMQAVSNAEQALTNATAELTSAKSQLQRLIPSGYTIDTFRALPQLANIEQAIEENQRAIETATTTRRNADTIRQKGLLELPVIPQIPAQLHQSLQVTLDTITLEAEQRIKEHIALHSSNVELGWINRGVLSQKNDDCPFCGRDMHGLDILASYRAYFSGSLQSHQIELEQLLATVEDNFGKLAQQRFIESFRRIGSSIEWWSTIGELQIENPFTSSEDEILTQFESVRTSLSNAINRKKVSPTGSTELLEVESAAITSWENFQRIHQQIMNSIDSINNSIAEKKRSIGNVDISTLESNKILLNAKKKRYESDVISAFASYENALENKTRKERDKSVANEALRQDSIAIFSRYGSRINNILDQFGADFRIVDVGVQFTGGSPSGKLAIEILGRKISTALEDARDPSKASLANTISAGDKSALAVAFFIAVIESDALLSDSIVVFDDPFQSQDRRRRQRTIEYIQNIALRCRQCFVFSHELDFSRAVSRIHGVEAQTFVINAVSEDSVLTAGELPPLPGEAFIQDYRLLKDYLDRPSEELDRMKSVGRSLRQCLEAYLRHKYPLQWNDNEWLGDMIGSIRSSNDGDLVHKASRLVDKLTHVNEYSKRFYHSEVDGSTASDIDGGELRTYVSETIEIIST